MSTAHDTPRSFFAVNFRLSPFLLAGLAFATTCVAGGLTSEPGAPEIGRAFQAAVLCVLTGFPAGALCGFLHGTAMSALARLGLSRRVWLIALPISGFLSGALPAMVFVRPASILTGDAVATGVLLAAGGVGATLAIACAAIAALRGHLPAFVAR